MVECAAQAFELLEPLLSDFHGTLNSKIFVAETTCLCKIGIPRSLNRSFIDLLKIL